MEGDVITLQELFEFKIERIDADRTVVGAAPADRPAARRSWTSSSGTASSSRTTSSAAPQLAALAAGWQSDAAASGGARRAAPGCRGGGSHPCRRRGARDRAGHAAAVSRARLRRQFLRRSRARRVLLQVRENGGLVRDVRVTPVAASGLRFGAILAVDASKSMAGPPFTAAMNAARTFVNERQEGAELGFVAFNGDVTVVQAPTSNAEALTQAFRNPPELAYGTRIYDALDRSIELLRDSRISAGTVVLLSDGADVGSSWGLDRVVAAAERARVRIFTIGLRSDAYDGTALQEIARRTGGTYAEASSAAELDADLRRARTAARERVPRSLPLRRPTRVPRRRRRHPRRRRQRTRRLRRSDPGPHRPLPPVAGLALRPGTGVHRGGRARLRATAGLGAAPAHPRPQAQHRRADRPLLHRGSDQPRRASARGRPQGDDREPLHARLVGTARARPRDRTARLVRAEGRVHDGRSLPRARGRARAVLVRPGAVRTRGASGGGALDHPVEAPVASQRVHGPAPGRAPGARLVSPRRPQLQRRARQCRPEHDGTGPLRAATGRAGRPAGRAPRGRHPQDGRPHGQPRPRAGRAPRRAPAHRGRQLGRGARHRRRDDPPARRAPAARPLSHRAGPHGSLDPHRHCRSR